MADERELTLQSFLSQLREALRVRPVGTTADLLDGICAYWDGACVVGVFLRDDDSGRLDESFEFSDYEWEQWRPELTAWLSAPQFSERDELKAWLA